jgi:imidazolonepropionase-like amidohydrolase
MTEMKRILKNCRIIDGAGGVIEKGWLLLEGSLISGLGHMEQMPRHVENEVGAEDTVDASGKTVMPGLIDCHVHLALDGSPDPMSKIAGMTDPMATLHMVRHGEAALRAGVTTVRDLGSKNFIDLQVRDAVNMGLVKGPRMLCAGQMICITGGHGWQMGCEADGPDGVKRATRKQIKAGVDCVKFMATGGVLTRGGKPGVPQLDGNELKAGIEEAHKVSLKTAAHSQGPEGSRNAVLAGIDSIEHGVALAEETIEEMIRRNVFLVPTFSAPVNITTKGTDAGIPEEFVEKSKRVQDEHIRSVLRARKAGVKIAMGTDAGTPFNRHGENPLELYYMTRFGFSAHEAIVSATSRAAELLGLEQRTGTIAPGRLADLLVVEGNPLEDIRVLADPARIVAVFKEGREVSDRNILPSSSATSSPS